MRFRISSVILDYSLVGIMYENQLEAYISILTNSMPESISSRRMKTFMHFCTAMETYLFLHLKTEFLKGRNTLSGKFGSQKI